MFHNFDQHGRTPSDKHGRTPSHTITSTPTPTGPQVRAYCNQSPTCVTTLQAAWIVFRINCSTLLPPLVIMPLMLCVCVPCPRRGHHPSGVQRHRAHLGRHPARGAPPHHELQRQDPALERSGPAGGATQPLPAPHLPQVHHTRSLLWGLLQGQPHWVLLSSVEQGFTTSSHLTYYFVILLLIFLYTS